MHSKLVNRLDEKNINHHDHGDHPSGVHWETFLGWMIVAIAIGLCIGLMI